MRRENLKTVNGAIVIESRVRTLVSFLPQTTQLTLLRLQGSEVFDEVADLSFGEDEADGRHGGNDFAALFDVAGFDFSSLVVGVADFDDAIFLAAVASGDGAAVVECEGNGTVAFGNDFLWLCQCFQKIGAVFLATD